MELSRADETTQHASHTLPTMQTQHSMRHALTDITATQASVLSHQTLNNSSAVVYSTHCTDHILFQSTEKRKIKPSVLQLIILLYFPQSSHGMRYQGCLVLTTALMEH